MDPLYYQLSSAQLYNPQLMNAYSYANNNPVSNTDPTGLSFMSSITSAYNYVSNKVQSAYTAAVNYFSPSSAKSNVTGGNNAPSVSSSNGKSYTSSISNSAVSIAPAFQIPFSEYHATLK